MIKVVLLILIVLLSLYGYKQSQDRQLQKEAKVFLDTEKMKEKAIQEQEKRTTQKSLTIEKQSLNTTATARPVQPKYRCDGREHCSQMNSYEEAKFFLHNCPNTKMDGDGDGIPCERQFRRYD